MSGTPKTLQEAIQNGLIEQANKPWGKKDYEVVEDHVRDFLAQVFTTHLVLSEELKDPIAQEALRRLWADLFPRS